MRTFCKIIAMINEWIGQLGHMLVILSFVSSLLAAYGYFRANALEDKSWYRFARTAFWVHGLAVMGVVIVLFAIIYGHYYEYHYAWSHSSNNLPTHFMISCFWEGQEGSFLLWIFWHVLMGWAVMWKEKKWEAPVMAVFALVQAFLASMILGVVVPWLELKIGSSPFILMRDAMLDAPVFQIDPNFIPEDGTGLNPLLQNYWMVIHPPTLFLGFAATLVPFAFLIAGLQNGKYKEWVRPALPWTIFAVLILGVGIMMGAYWAYETLNFGGYWNWDPVENAVYIPWLTLVAGLHVMLIFQKRPAALSYAMGLIALSFILILYSTFLTRSGILGEASVHSFTDLGLSGQLLIYLLVFTGIALYYMAKAWPNLPSADLDVPPKTGEFWMFIGAAVLVLSAFQVLVPTSVPVYNAILQNIGIESNLAPPADQVKFYTKYQLWFGLAIAVLSGVAQLFWWRGKKDLKETFLVPVILTMLVTGGVVVFAEMKDPIFMALLTAGVFSLAVNGQVMLRLSLKGKTVKLSGGAIAHTGIALMLLGILSSSGYSKIVSMNTSGLLYSREFSDEMNQENLLLFLNQPQDMGRYKLTYKGTRMTSKEIPGYIDLAHLAPAGPDIYRRVLTSHVLRKGDTLRRAGDTIQVYNENTYYEIEYERTDTEKQFTLYPRVQNNPQMGFVPSPDIRQAPDRDLYTHITNIPDPEEGKEWGEVETKILHLKDTFVVNDYIAQLRDVTVKDAREDKSDTLTAYDITAHVDILDREGVYKAQPQFKIRGNRVQRIPAEIGSLGIRLTLNKINHQDKNFEFQLQTAQKDWVILKAIEMPLINLLWAGVIVMSLGLGVALKRRWAE